MGITLVLALKLIVALGLLNVWLLRSKKATDYRGGSSTNIVEEFEAYGLPKWFCYLIGFLKVTSAGVLLLSLWQPTLALPAAALITALMIGAIGMHLKVSDPLKKSLPAAAMLLMSLSIVITQL